MVVLCPACRTRYRYHAGDDALARMAQCSRCEQTFPLEPARRSYVLRSAAEPGELAWAGAADGGRPSLALEGGIDPAMEATGERGAESRTGPSPNVVVESAIALLPAAVGAYIAYDLAGRQDQDPLTWAALGAAVGLLLGWTCLLWIARKD